MCWTVIESVEHGGNQLGVGPRARKAAARQPRSEARLPLGEMPDCVAVTQSQEGAGALETEAMLPRWQ